MRNKKILLLSLALLGVVGTSIGMNSYQNVVNKAEATGSISTYTVYDVNTDAGNLKTSYSFEKDNIKLTLTNVPYNQKNDNYGIYYSGVSDSRYILFTILKDYYITSIKCDIYVNGGRSPTLVLSSTSSSKPVPVEGSATVNVEKSGFYKDLEYISNSNGLGEGNYYLCAGNGSIVIQKLTISIKEPTSTPEEGTAVFDAGEGYFDEPTEKSKIVKQDESGTITAPQNPTREHYNFLYWALKDDETKQKVETFEVGKTYIAVWEVDPTSSVQLSIHDDKSNLDLVTDTKSVVKGSKLLEQLTNYENTSEYSFGGWFLDKDFSQQINGETIVPETNFSVYAKWIKLSKMEVTYQWTFDKDYVKDEFLGNGLYTTDLFKWDETNGWTKAQNHGGLRLDVAKDGKFELCLTIPSGKTLEAKDTTEENKNVATHKNENTSFEEKFKFQFDVLKDHKYEITFGNSSNMQIISASYTCNDDIKESNYFEDLETKVQLGFQNVTYHEEQKNGFKKVTEVSEVLPNNVLNEKGKTFTLVYGNNVISDKITQDPTTDGKEEGNHHYYKATDESVNFKNGELQLDETQLVDFKFIGTGEQTDDNKDLFVLEEEAGSNGLTGYVDITNTKQLTLEHDFVGADRWTVELDESGNIVIENKSTDLSDNKLMFDTDQNRFNAYTFINASEPEKDVHKYPMAYVESKEVDLGSKKVYTFTNSSAMLRFSSVLKADYVSSLTGSEQFKVNLKLSKGEVNKEPEIANIEIDKAKLEKNNNEIDYILYGIDAYDVSITVSFTIGEETTKEKECTIQSIVDDYIKSTDLGLTDDDKEMLTQYQSYINSLNA